MNSKNSNNPKMQGESSKNVEYNSSLEKNQLKYLLGLSLVPGLGPIYLKKALQFEPDPEKLWRSSSSRLASIFGHHLAGKIAETRKEVDLDQKISELAEKNIQVVSFADPRYPGLLLEIPDPPPILFYQGSIHPAKPAVAIVGSRKATGYGKKITKMLARELAYRGIIIVSGLALGIDRAAHEGALDAGGESWAVLGSGLDYQYPPENQDLYQELPESGALISEFPPEIKPQPGNFPRRNRIISGLCQGVVVVEAADKSGSLITASLALDQNRQVLAVPGNIDRLNSRGTNNLIKEGAMPVTSTEDIISYLYQLYSVNHNSKFSQNNSQGRQSVNPIRQNGGSGNSEPDSAPFSTKSVIIPPDLSPAEKKILDIFTREIELTMNELQELTDIGAVGISVALINLEVAGVIEKGEGEKYYFKGLQNLLEPI